MSLKFIKFRFMIRLSFSLPQHNIPSILSRFWLMDRAVFACVKTIFSPNCKNAPIETLDIQGLCGAGSPPKKRSDFSQSKFIQQQLRCPLPQCLSFLGPPLLEWDGGTAPPPGGDPGPAGAARLSAGSGAWGGVCRRGLTAPSWSRRWVTSPAWPGSSSSPSPWVRAPCPAPNIWTRGYDTQHTPCSNIWIQLDGTPTSGLDAWVCKIMTISIITLIIGIIHWDYYYYLLLFTGFHRLCGRN